MKLLYDQNLSHKLVAALSDLFPGSAHVRDYGLQDADDSVVWGYAKVNGFTIVSKDDDFHQRSFVLGHPPKVICVRLGNCTTAAIESAIRTRVTEVRAFGADSDSAFLILS